jgi:hypothetical protein
MPRFFAPLLTLGLFACAPAIEPGEYTMVELENGCERGPVETEGIRVMHGDDDAPDTLWMEQTGIGGNQLPIVCDAVDPEDDRAGYVCLPTQSDWYHLVVVPEDRLVYVRYEQYLDDGDGLLATLTSTPACEATYVLELAEKWDEDRRDPDFNMLERASLLLFVPVLVIHLALMD